MRIKKRTRSTYQPLLSLGHILRNLAVDQYLISDKHQLLSVSTTSHSHGVIALWQEGIPVETECVSHSGNPKTRWVRTWRSRICAAFLNMSHEEEIVYKHIFGLLSKQLGSFCLLAYFWPIPHALFLWLSGKVKAKIVLAKEFWAKSRIAPAPLAQYGTGGPLTRQHSERRQYRGLNYATSYASPFWAAPFFHLRPGLRHTFAHF